MELNRNGAQKPYHPFHWNAICLRQTFTRLPHSKQQMTEVSPKFQGDMR